MEAGGEPSMEGLLQRTWRFDEAELSQAAHWINANGYTRIAAQFPDEWLRFAADATLRLRALLPGRAKVFLLADSTYNSECVDEVAAAHAQADCVVHFGRADLSPASTLPAFFCFGRAELPDLPHLARVVAEHVGMLPRIGSSQETCPRRCIVLLDQPFLHEAGNIEELLKQATLPLPTEVARAASRETRPVRGGAAQADDINAPSDPRATAERGACKSAGADVARPDPIAGSAAAHAESDGPAECVWSRDAGYLWGWGDGKGDADGPNTHDTDGGLAADHDADDAKRIAFIWVGPTTPALRQLKLTFSQASWARVDILSWPEADPGTDARRDTYRIELEHEASLINTLTGRYFLIDKAKDANIIGILVGTLGAAGFRQVIERIRSLAESAGKKTYTVLVGKPNPAKLANFPEVDIWVMVATGQGMILDNRDYHKKIITPFEAEIAFGAKDWDGSYTLDCRELLEGFKADTPKSHGIQGAELDEADQLDDDEHEDLTTALVQSSERALKIKGNTDAVVGTAAEYYMAKRTWWGVDESAEDDEPPAEIVPGQSGRAVGYENEGNAFRG